MKKLLSLLLVVGLLLSLAVPYGVEAYIQGDFEYFITNGGTGATITSYTGQSTNSIIPSVLGGYAVIGIADEAFGDCKQVEVITIPESVTEIGKSAFVYCESLTEIRVNSNNDNYSSENGVLFNKSKTILLSYPRGKPDTRYTIPSSVTTVSGGAFTWCNFLEELFIPQNVDSIECLFDGCVLLTNINVDQNNLNYRSENGVLFDKNTKELLQYPPAKLDIVYTVPSGTTGIGPRAFGHTRYLTVVNIPENVITIGEEAFFGSDSLAKLCIPVSTTTIGYNIVERCNNFTAVFYAGSQEEWEKINFSSGNYTLLDDIFVDRNFLDGSQIDGNYTYIIADEEVTIVSYIGNATNLTIPETLGGYPVTSIGNHALLGNKDLEKVSVPKSVTVIGNRAFYFCQSLKDIEVDLNNPNYCSDDGVLFNKNKSALIQYPRAKTDISYTVPEGITTIENDAFSFCEFLVDITFPISVNYIGFDVVEQCNDLAVVYYVGSKDDWYNITVKTWDDIDAITIYDKICVLNGVPTNQDKIAAREVIEQITMLNETDADVVQTARSAYNGLTQFQKGMIINLNKLEKVEAQLGLTPVASTYGNLDGDDKVSAADALMVLKCVVGKITFTDQLGILADVSNNQRIGAEDALYILQKVVGKIMVFPAEENLILPTPDPDPQPNPTPDPEPTTTIALASCFSEKYTSDDAEGRIYAAALNAMEGKGIQTTIRSLNEKYATDTIEKECMAGKAADIYEVSLVACRNLQRSSLYGSKTLNKSLFQCAATESVTFYSDKPYGVTWASKSPNPMGVIYNKNLLKKYASDWDVEGLYDEKKWNFDVFQTIAKTCTVDTNGDNKTDIYGFTSDKSIIDMAVTANAGGIASRIGTGRVEATLCSENSVKALEWCKEMLKDDKSWLYKADINVAISEFVTGNTAMFVSHLNHIPQVASQANFEMGLLPMPIGTNQFDYKNGVYDGSYYIYGNNYDQLDAIGIWLNEMAQHTSEPLLNNRVDELARQGFDRKSQEIYKWMVNNMTPDFSAGVFSTAVTDEIYDSVTAKAKTPAKVVASLKTKAQQECDWYY